MYKARIEIEISDNNAPEIKNNGSKYTNAPNKKIGANIL